MSKSKDVWSTIATVAFVLVLLVTGWFARPYLRDLVSRPRPGAPQPGEDCYEADWDEWGRPLWVCELESPTWPIDRDDPPLYVSEPPEPDHDRWAD